MGGDFSEFRLPEGLKEAPAPAWTMVEASVEAETEVASVSAPKNKREEKSSVWKRMGEKLKKIFRK